MWCDCKWSHPMWYCGYPNTYTIAKSQETSRQPDLLRVMLRVPRAGPHYVQQIYVCAPPIPYTKSPTEPDPTAKIRAARLPVQRRVAIVS